MALPRHLLGRFYLLAVLLAVDAVVSASISHHSMPIQPLARMGIVAYAVFLGLGYSTLKARQEDIPFGSRTFAAHLVCVAAVWLANLVLLRGIWLGPLRNAVPAASSVVMLLGIALLALACIPLRIWIEIVRSTGFLWLYSLFAGALAWRLQYPLQSFWNASTAASGRILQIATFRAVQAVLPHLLPDVVVDPATFIIGTPRFSVFVAKECSGMEGLGLVLVFTLVWLWFFRKEIRFPQAFLLIPCALGCVWLLNIARICVLILIGAAGASDIAMVGFHSQAGWMAFTAIALAFSMAARRIPWVRRDPARATTLPPRPAIGEMQTAVLPSHELVGERGESPAVGAYLAPFLAILAASFVSKAVSGYFEWLYPLRFVVAAIALWHYWPEYRKLNWRFGWLAPVTGLAIFLLWNGADWWLHAPSASPLGSALATLSPAPRVVWIAFRFAAAVLTVPIAKELAFCGFLSRRLMDRNFDAVPFTSLTALSVCLTSVAFGVMVDQHWLIGMVSGLAFALLLKSRGRIGDAVVAHATCNFLIAVWVLSHGDWARW
jgi:exosortase E/protease (VPEID-CTERM system)